MSARAPAPGSRLRRNLFRIGLGAVLVATGLLAGVWVLIAQPSFIEPGSNPPGITVDPARLEAHVRTLSETFVPRSSENLDNLDRTAEYIHDAFTRAGATASFQTFQLFGKLDYRNVVAAFGPPDGERIVIGAHYDTYQELPGANDNASGVAALIELARLLSTTRLALRVELVAFTLEEPPYFATPHMGSAVHARGLREANVSVRLMMSLETVGHYDDRPGSQRYPMPLLELLYPSRGDFIAVVGRIDQRETVGAVKRAMREATTLPVQSISAFPSVPGIDFSDHRNYWAAGYPAVMITDTAFMRSKTYHTADDTADTLDYVRMAEVVKGVYAVVAGFASRARARRLRQSRSAIKIGQPDTVFSANGAKPDNRLPGHGGE